MTNYEDIGMDDDFSLYTPVPLPVSAARVEANRSNARMSTGPKTEAGKAKSRVNATKHGLKSLTLPRGDDGTVVEADRHAFIQSLGACDVLSTRLADVAYRCCRRLERVLDAEDAAVAERVDAAETMFYEERFRVFIEMIDRRFDHPVKLRLHFQRTLDGCMGLVAEFEGMIKTLADGEWDVDMGNSFVNFCAHRGVDFEPDMPGWSAAIMVGQNYVKIKDLPYLGIDRTEYDKDDAVYQNMKKHCPNLDQCIHDVHQKRAAEWWQKFDRKKAEFEREYPRVGPACEAAQEQVLMRLQAEIQFLMNLAQELEDEEAHALSVAREKAKFDPSDEGRLRHRYLVEARRDLSRSVEDTRKAVAEARRQAVETAAESRPKPTPNEPKREQTADVVQPSHAVHQDVAECTTSDVSHDFVNFAITPPAPHHRA